MHNTEIDEGREYIGYKDALTLIATHTSPIKEQGLDLAFCTGYVSAENVIALVDSPNKNMSLKDGFAVRVHDVVRASFKQPVKLRMVGSVFAGGTFNGQLSDRQAVKIYSGSPVPAGAEAVVSAEFCEELGSEVYIKADAEVGRNIFYAGEDVRTGSIVVEKGKTLLPARLSLIAAAGINTLKVYQKPRTALIAIGDEVIAPGQKIKEGQLYASNLVNVGAWLSCFGIPYTTTITVDAFDSIKSELLKSFPGADVIVTSGGAWRSERDLIVKVLDSLGWKRVFHHVRIGPGKGIAFGIWKDKPVFCLPGGPPSNEIAFLQLALPGILHLAGLTGSPLCTISAELTQDVQSRNRAWTEFTKAKITRNAKGHYLVTPYFETSRLKSMADSHCLICKPEGVASLYCGQIITVQAMIPTFVGLSIADIM